MRRRNLLTGAALVALLRPKSAAAAWAQFMDSSGVAAPPPPPPGQIASIPLGSFSVQQNTGGFAAANGDGTTGWTTNGSITILQFWFNFPADQFYQFVVPCFSPTWNGGQANSVAGIVDQLTIQADGGNQTNLNYYLYFVSNQAPSQNFSFTGPIRQGWHSIQIFMNQAAYTGLQPSLTNTPMHGDRLNIIATGITLPAEPAPQTRDPGKFPMSSWHFINTPFGAGAQWLALNNPIAQVINGTGGNGANISPSVLTDSVNNWYGQASDPVWTAFDPNDTTNHPTSPIGGQYPVRAPAGLYPTFGSTDKGICLCDTTNPRFRYSGGALFASGDRTINYGNMWIQDSYNLNQASPQLNTNGHGILTVQDLDAGAILHRLDGGLAAYTGASNVGYGLGQQTSQQSGLPWPGAESDFDWKSGNRYGNPVGPPYNSVLGIPSNIAKPGGLNTGTSMVWDCFQHYGLWLNVSAGNANSPGITLYVEGAAFNHPIFNQINFGTIVPNLSVLSNPAPIVLNTSNPQGYGGGNVIVPLLPGLVQGYPSLGLPPYVFPASPVGIPIQCGPSRTQSPVPSGVASSMGCNSSSVGVGTFVLVFLCFDRVNATTVQFTGLTDGANNTYTIIQPSAVVGVNPIAIAYNPSVPNAIPFNTTWKATVAPGGQVNIYYLGAYYRPAPPTGLTSLRVSNSTSSSSNVGSLTTSLAGVQVGDLIIEAALTSNYAEIINPAGYGSLNPQPPMNIGFKVATAAGTQTINPSWPTYASPAALVAAAFANANIAT